MKLYILFGHRAERYSGEYAPEPLLCWSEYEVDENPEGFDADLKKTLSERGTEFAATKLIHVKVNSDSIMRAIHEVPVIEAELDDE